MHPSVNYDYVIHGDHIHWCNVEARGMTRCEELAMREHSTITADAAVTAITQGPQAIDLPERPSIYR